MPRSLFHRWLTCLTIVAIAGSLTAGAASATKKTRPTDRFYEHAIELLAKGDQKGAIIELKNALQADPKDIAARVLLGNTYLDIEDGASAAKEFLRARKDGARDSFVLAPLGRAYVLQGLYRQAIKELSAVGQNQAIAAEIAVIRGDAHLALREFAEAEKSYLEASKIRANATKALVGLARVKIGTDDLRGADRYIGWALEANPKDPEVWYVKGEIARLRLKIPLALEHYNKAIELAPRYGIARLARAAILVDLGRHEEAEPDILLVREKNPRDAQAAYLHSLILTRMGRIKEAQNALIDAENVLKTYSAAAIEAHPPSMLLLGVVSYFRKNYDAAFVHLSDYLKRVPQHLGARLLLASLSMRAGEVDSAIVLLEGLVARLPDDVDVLTMYGDALMRKKRFREASKVLEKAASLAKSGSMALSRLVALRFTAGQDSAATEILESEMKRNPDAVQAALMLGATQLNQGKYEEALKTLKGVLERQPDNPVAHNVAGGASVGLKDYEGARRSFTAAFEAVPAYVLARSNLAKLEGRLGDWERAAELYLQIVEYDPQNGSAMIALAEIARRKNEMDRAIRWLERARTKSRAPGVASLRLIDIYIASEKPDRALSVARELNGAHPSNLVYLTALGRARMAARQTDSAAEAFREVAKRAQKRKLANWLVRAAVWQARVLDKPGALDSLQKALAIDGKYIPAHLELFKMDMAANRLDDAITRARQIVSFNARSPLGSTLLGDAYMRMGSFDLAFRAYSLALKKDPNSSLARRIYRARRAAGQSAFDFAVEWAQQRPDDATAQRLLADAYADSGKNAEALAIYNRLLTASPDDTALLNNLALLHQKMDGSRALEYALRAYRAAPDRPAVMDTYGWILIQHDEVEKGLTILRNAKLRAPSSPEIRYHIAVGLNKLGQKEKARQELLAALQSGQLFEGADEARALLARLPSPQR